MIRPSRLLAWSSTAAAVGGMGAITLALLGWPASAAPGAPTLGGISLVLGGFVTLAGGLYGLMTWVAASEAALGHRLAAEADAYASLGRSEWALALYEEALRQGADPDYVERRLDLVRSRVARATAHRERA